MKKEIKYDIVDKGCWECTSHKTNRWGYPLITIQGKTRLLKRHMYEQKYSITLNIEEKLYCKCNNKLCINPDHFYLIKAKKDIKHVKVINTEIGGECWECTSHSIGSHGYIQYQDPISKKNILLHQYILKHKLGREIEKDMFVHHLCNNKLCINPDHLEECIKDFNNKLRIKTKTPITRITTMTYITKTILKTMLVVTDKNEEIIYNFKVDIMKEHNIPLNIIDKLLSNKLEEYKDFKIKWLRRKSYKRQVDHP